jgi:cytoskeleton protein RodZ
VNTSTTATLSTEGGQTFLQQIEAQLLSSDTYHQLLTAVQTKLGGVAEEFQSLLTALSREAIQYTIHRLMGEAAVSVDAAGAAEAHSFTDTATIESEVSEAAPEASFSAPEILDRDRGLLQLGQRIRQGREAKGLTLQELHHQTYVPLHHLKALELGQLDKLPEEVFLRGFVRQIGKVLGMSDLVEVVPAPEPVKKAVLSGKKAGFQPIDQISPVHLYVGYAALMAGAVGGLTWISQPAQSDAPAVKPTPEAQVNGVTRGVSQVSALAHSSMSPPETMRVR